MSYSDSLVNTLTDEYPIIQSELRDLRLKCFLHGEGSPHPRVKEHLLQGAARRVAVLSRSIENIFSLFPLNRTRLLGQDELSDVGINLHAFLMNLYGVLDNWAWAFVLRHDLKIPRQQIGLFIEKTRERLPPGIKSYVSHPATLNWYEKYLKSYRDALAHRIPPYVPPSELTPAEGERFKQLQSESLEGLKVGDLARYEKAREEQGALGRPSFTFLHSFTEKGHAEHLMLHPQILNDGRTLAEFGLRFLKHWHEHV